MESILNFVEIIFLYAVSYKKHISFGIAMHVLFNNAIFNCGWFEALILIISQ